MKRLPALLAVLLAACSGIPRHPDRLRYRELHFDVPDPDAMRVPLPGGAAAFLLEDDALPLVDLQVFVRRASHDPQGKEGLGAFTGSLMRTGGTKSRGPAEIDEELEFLAAEVSVSVDETHGSASLSVLSKDLDRGLEILLDLLREPAFQQEKLDILKAQTLESLRARNDSTASIEDRESDLLFFGPGHPASRRPTRASVESIQREDLIDFHAKSFAPRNFIVAAAGAFRKEELALKLGAAFRNWPHRGGEPVSMPGETPQPRPGVYCFHKEGKNINQGRVAAGHMGIDVHHPDVHAVRLLSYILGAGGFSSRLMQKVRAEEGLAYDVHSDFRPGLFYPLPFRVRFQSKSGTCAYAAKLCLEEIARLRKEDVSREELDDAIRFYLDGFPGFFFATKSRTAATYAQAELYGIPKDYYLTYREKIARLTPADIRRAAQERLKPENFVWIVVGDIPAIKKGDPGRGAALSDLGPLFDVPLPDPLTLERPQ